MKMLSKKHIRRATIEKLKGFNKDKKSIADQWFANELFNTQAYQDAKSIGFVLSMPHEVDTYHLIESSIMNDKKVYVPETDYKNKRMSFKRLLSLNDIEKDEKGIYHAVSNTELTNDMDLLVVPGVAFEENGYRIGYGGGYYDKFLTQFKTRTVSLLYDFQLTTFDKESFDQPVDQLIIYNNNVVEE